MKQTRKNYEKVYKFYTDLFEATDEWVETCEKIGFKDWDLSIRGCRTTRFYLDWLDYDRCTGDLLQDKWDEMTDLL